MFNNSCNINGQSQINIARSDDQEFHSYELSPAEQVALSVLEQLRNENSDQIPNEFGKRNMEFLSATEEQTDTVGKNKLFKRHSTSSYEVPIEQLSEYGTVKYPNGAIYNGFILNGHPHGKGERIFKTGDWLKGEFKYGIFIQGTGKLTDICGKGTNYEGEIKGTSPYKGVKFHGRGKMTYPNGDVIIVNFFNGKRVAN